LFLLFLRFDARVFFFLGFELFFFGHTAAHQTFGAVGFARRFGRGGRSGLCLVDVIELGSEAAYGAERCEMQHALTEYADGIVGLRLHVLAGQFHRLHVAVLVVLVEVVTASDFGLHTGRHRNATTDMRNTHTDSTANPTEEAGSARTQPLLGQSAQARFSGCSPAVCSCAILTLGT
jgi:hypothetical protein